MHQLFLSEVYCYSLSMKSLYYNGRCRFEPMNRRHVSKQAGNIVLPAEGVRRFAARLMIVS